MLQLVELYNPVVDDINACSAIFDDELISDQGFISDLCQHISRFRGKQMRPALLLLTGQACGGTQHAHRVMAAVIEMIHIATLVHDDILDEADIRRRAATVNRLWGNERAVLMGDFLLSHALHLCSTIDSADAARMVARATNIVCEGEMMQAVNRFNFDLDERLYLDIISRKTAALMGVCCEIGAFLCEVDEKIVADFREFGILLGIAFQITDDVLDLVGDEAEVGKSLRRDVEEGKLTLPLVHYLRTASDDRRQRMLALLQDDADGRHVEIAKLLIQSESVDYARQVACEHLELAKTKLSVVEPSPARGSLEAMVDFVLERER